MSMKRWLAYSAVVVILAGCAPALKDLKPTLTATDSGNIWFATAGSLGRAADGSRFTPGDPLVISGDLRFPSGAGPFPAVAFGTSAESWLNQQTQYDLWHAEKRRKRLRVSKLAPA
jgi:hypothetical protein